MKAGMSIEYYVFNVLEPRVDVIKKQKAALKAWQTAIQDLGRKWGEQANAPLKQRLEKQREAWARGEQGEDPQEASYQVEWESARLRVEESDARPQTKQRFRELDELAEAARHETSVTIDPPYWQTGKSSEEFCEDLRGIIYGVRLKYYDRKWKVANDAAAATDPIQKSEAEGYAELMDALERGDTGWLPQETPPEGEYPLEVAKRLGFQSEESGITGRWQFRATIGQTPLAHAGLWAQYDRDLNVTSKIVIKETYMEAEVWNLWKFWKEPEINQIPLEFSMPKRLQAREQADNIVKHLTYTLHSKKRMFRLYQEFCEHLSLAYWISNHAALVGPGGPISEIGGSYGSLIPTRAIWAIFEALASALRLMKNGHLPKLDRNPGWETIHHIDIKPQNVFLAKPDSNLWDGIPIAKLGDYGLAHPAEYETRKRPGAPWIGSGTMPYKAPEQFSQKQLEEEEIPPEFRQPQGNLTPARDTWGVGRTMLCLMNLQETDTVVRCNFDPESSNIKLEDRANAFCPAKLRSLVEACSEPRSADRIKAEVLWEQIHLEVTTFKGLRGPMKLEKKPAGEMLMFEEDKYLKWADAR